MKKLHVDSDKFTQGVVLIFLPASLSFLLFSLLVLLSLL